MAIRRSGWWASAGMAFLLSGCVERYFVVETTPPGAMVYVNNKSYGPSPATVRFIYYGKYQITLVLDGHQTQIVQQQVEAPFYAYPPIDLVVENFVPFKISDHPKFHYEMTPITRPNLDELRLRAEEVRERGRSLPPPSKPYNSNPDRPAPPPPPWRGPANPSETLPPPTAPAGPPTGTLPPPMSAPPSRVPPPEPVP